MGGAAARPWSGQAASQGPFLRAQKGGQEHRSTGTGGFCGTLNCEKPFGLWSRLSGCGVPCGGHGLPAWLQGKWPVCGTLWRDLWDQVCVALGRLLHAWPWSVPGPCGSRAWRFPLGPPRAGHRPCRRESVWSYNPQVRTGHVSGSQTLLHGASQAPAGRRAWAAVLSLRLGDGDHRQPEREPHRASTGTQHRPLVTEMRAATEEGIPSCCQPDAPLLGAKDGDRGWWPCGPGAGVGGVEGQRSG